MRDPDWMTPGIKQKQKTRIAEEIVLSGYSYRNLAIELGYEGSSGTVGNWATGRAVPDIVTIIDLARVLHVSPWYLLGFSDDKDCENCTPFLFRVDSHNGKKDSPSKKDEKTIFDKVSEIGNHVQTMIDNSDSIQAIYQIAESLSEKKIMQGFNKPSAWDQIKTKIESE